MDTPPPNPFLAISLKLASVTIFIVMAALIKASADEVPTGEAVFFRSFFALFVIVGWLAVRGELRGGLATRDKTGHFLRAIIGTLSMGCMFAALGLLPLPEVTAIAYAQPVLLVVVAAIMLGERVRLYRMSAVALGMIGVLVILWPRLTAFGSGAQDLLALGAALALLAAVFSALAQVFVRRMVATESTSAIVFWFSLTSTVLSLLTLPFGWAVPGVQTTFLLVLAGLLGGIGQIALTMAYRHAEAALVAPFEYASMVISILIGYFVFSEVPGIAVLAGAALVIAAGVIIILRERSLGIERAKQRQTASMKPL